MGPYLIKSNFQFFFPLKINGAGGVSLLRAAAKNHERVAVICDPHDYENVVNELHQSTESELSLNTR